VPRLGRPVPASELHVVRAAAPGPRRGQAGERGGGASPRDRSVGSRHVRCDAP